MASEETTLTASNAEGANNAVTENNENTISAHPAAGTEAFAQEDVGANVAQPQNSADTNTAETGSESTIDSPASQGFATEATTPEINALDEVHSSEQAAAAGSEAAPDNNTETQDQNAAPQSDTNNFAASDSLNTTTIGNVSDESSPEAVANENENAAQADESEADRSAKRENVVVKKLKLNPKATPTANASSASTSNETSESQASGNASSATSASSAVSQRAASASASSKAQNAEEQNDVGMDFGAILEQFEQEQARFREGDLLEGKVVGVSERGVTVDFGYKSEGIVPQSEFMQDGVMTVKPGDTVEVVLRKMDGGDGIPELSRIEAIKIRTWDELEQASREGTVIRGRVIDKVKGGLSVDVNGVEAFLPGSQIDSRPPRNLDVYKNQEIEARVIKFSRKRGNVVLSRKVIIDEVVNAQKSETLEQIAEGYIVEGKIKSLTDYGAFVDLGGIDGLLHVTDMSWGKLDKPSDMFKPNDDVQVKVLKIDRDKERISLGLKQLVPNPWSSVEERYSIGSKHIGKVSSITDYGAFVEIEPGVEGLVHVSEMTWSKRAKHPNKIVHVGQDIEVQVLRIDQKDRRISLGMRQVMSNPWETIYERYPVGTQVHGRVRNMTDFGAFVELEEGVDGLVHLSDISWSKKIKHPSDVLKKNQEVDAVVTGINVEGRRMSLSMKELQPSAWERFVSEHKPGDVVHGKISRFANFGVFVELADDLEGLCHISELSDERIEKPEKVFEIGQEMDFKILRIEPDVQKIGLSHRAVGKEDEPVIDTKTYSTEAKSGMASLAELANLRNMRGEE
jgi:small subunit ribosomal protein S1